MLGGNPGSASNPDTPATNLLYAGEQFDTDAQQYYLRARYYDPLNGRFNQMDPFAGNNQDPESLHKYLYCHANPANNVDPSGKVSFPTVGTLITIAIWAFLATVALTLLYVAYLGFRLVQKMRLISGCPFLDVEDHLRPAVRQMKHWPPGHRMKACAKWLEPALEPGYEANNHVKVFPGDENDIWGMHAEVSPYVFVCQWVVDNRNDLELALIIFAEWQHHPAGGDMEEGPAQADFERVREDLRRTGEITDFIESLTHGDQQ